MRLAVYHCSIKIIGRGGIKPRSAVASAAYFVSAGMCADFSIHDRQDGNPHAHIMLTMRPLEQSGKWGAKCWKEYILDNDGNRIRKADGKYKSRRADTCRFV